MIHCDITKVLKTRMTASESKLLNLFIHYLMKLIESWESSVSCKTRNHSETSQTK